MNFEIIYNSNYEDFNPPVDIPKSLLRFVCTIFEVDGNYVCTYGVQSSATSLLYVYVHYSFLLAGFEIQSFLNFSQ